MSPLEITRFAKSGGALTKKISLASDGKLISDGSACVMSSGTAHRVQLAGMGQLGTLIEQLKSDEAIALGALRAGLPDKVEIVTKSKLDKLNGAGRPDIIARTGSYIFYRSNQPALALLDYDAKGMPDEMAARLENGDYWRALVSIIPELRSAARVMRFSTSAGLFRSDTSAKLPGSSGRHLYVLAQDGADIDRFLRALHDRCWLAGFGWMMVGAGGQLLERSIVDRMVGAPERLVFEGAPVLEPPLAQDQGSRRPIVWDGAALDTLAACPPLTIVEKAKLRDLRAKEAHRLAPESAKAREAFIKSQAKRLVDRTGMSAEAAARIIARQCAGVLLPDVVLPFDDEELAGITVADVLADPARFEGATLADPLEGVEYGTCKAKIMRRADGSVWIHSFAHGRTVYELKLDARAVQEKLQKTPPDAWSQTFVRLVLAADLDDDQTENLAAERGNISKRVLDRMLKTAKQEQRRQHAQEERNRRAAERHDPRPQIDAPPTDAPWLPQMAVHNEVLRKATATEPPVRDIDNDCSRKKALALPRMHPLDTPTSNPGHDPQ